MNELIKMEAFSQSAYRKCECCSRVRDVYFRANVYDFEAKRMLIGSFELCKSCGVNFAKILGQTEIVKVIKKPIIY